MIDKWEVGMFRNLDCDIKRIEKYFVYLVFETANENLRTALMLMAKGFYHRVPERYMVEAIETGLVSPYLKIMYAFAQPYFAAHAWGYIDDEGNNSDYNGNLE
jgi:hypothetical protein